MAHAPIQVGTILTADPMIDGDPTFGRSVLLVLSHNEEGATAVNLAGKSVFEIIQDGGPETGNIIHFLRKAGTLDTEIGTSGYTAVEIVAMEGGAEKLRDAAESMTVPELAEALGPAALLMGRGNWAPRQMEYEKDDLNFWKISNASVEDILAAPPAQRWEVATTAKPATPEPKKPKKGPPPKPPRGTFEM